MGFIGAFDAVLEFIVLSGQEQRDLIVSGSRVAKRRRVSHGLSNLELMVAHVVFPTNGTPNARNLCALGAPGDGCRQEPPTRFTGGKSEHAPGDDTIATRD
jgi:hypothetical protein